MHEAVLEQTQAELRAATIVQRVRRAVRPRLAERPTLGEIARSLGMSERSMQRKLSEAGSAYGQVLDAARRDEVEQQLARTDASLATIAAATGFADASSLRRAFVRWTGQTPASWRAERS